jgi:hypothetical protein
VDAVVAGSAEEVFAVAVAAVAESAEEADFVVVAFAEEEASEVAEFAVAVAAVAAEFVVEETAVVSAVVAVAVARRRPPSRGWSTRRRSAVKFSGDVKRYTDLKFSNSSFHPFHPLRPSSCLIVCRASRAVV